MAYFDTRQAYEELKTATLEGIRDNFPLEGKKQTIELKGFEVRDDGLDPEDIESQHEAKINGRSWAAPVFGTLVMRDNATGKVVDEKKVKLADVPHMTKRHSYIVGGNEFQVDNQWRLKPGVYTRRKKSGEFEASFNVPNKSNFALLYDKDKRVFKMARGSSSSIPVYPLMKELGIDDAQLEKMWGKEVLAANRDARASAGAIEAFFRADKKRAPKDKDEARQYFHETMRESKLRKDSTEITLGKGFDSINGEVFGRATKKMLDVMNGVEKEDERDALVFKDLHTAADFVKERLTGWRSKSEIKKRVDRKINSADNIRQVIRGDMFSAPVQKLFTSDALSRGAAQVNPVEMLSSSFQTTITGPGGIQSEQAITDEAKLISPSHLGYLDPIRTPEGGKTGVTLRLPMGVTKNGNAPTIPVYNMKTGKMERIDPIQFHKSRVVMPDQVKWGKQGPVPLAKNVAMSQKGNELEDADFKDADYVLRAPSQLFSMTSNLIPFLGNNSGNRATYASNQIEQAISLQGREKPLVQVSTGSPGIKTFEEFVGRNSAHIAPDDGTVVSVDKKGIVVRDSKGKEHKVSLYDNFPLNDAKAVMDSTARVKPGDKVKKGQVVADNNFTEDGQLALGTNLTVGYIPLKGYNFEDGVVISESAAKKMSSVHMHKPATTLSPELITDPKKFRVFHPTTFTTEQIEKVGEDGVVKVGQRVMPGDPIVVAAKPYEARGSMNLGKLRKSLSNQFLDSSLTWKSDFPGEVVSVHRGKKGEVTVHVKTVEPMQIGDKMAGRYGNKGIITQVLPDSEMPQIKNGFQVHAGNRDVLGKELHKDLTVGGKTYKAGTKLDQVTIDDIRSRDPKAAVTVKQHLEVALNPSGVPGRMNMGQVLETAAAKVAKKTGQVYTVENFKSHDDAINKVMSDLKKAGVEDEDELVDPVTGKSLGKGLVGPQHMLKLNFQIDKKVSVRAGMPLEGAEPEGYDPTTLIPSQGGKAGGQSMGNLGMYSLLAHGAKHNIREMQTWKSEGPDPKEKWNSLHNEVWRAIQTGEEPPPPKKTFAFQKFEDMMRAAGINVEKKGHQLQLTPLTDAQVIAMSSGEIRDERGSLKYGKDREGNPQPVSGGIFDPKLTGGHGGTKWSHMTLPHPMPNPVFEGAIQKVLGITEKKYHAVIKGESGFRDGQVVPASTKGAVIGGLAISQMLERIDVEKELEKAEKELAGINMPADIHHRSDTQNVDKAAKKVRMLRALKTAGMSAKEAYTVKNLPIIPPVMRPASFLPSGDINEADLNKLYTDFGGIVRSMKEDNFKLTDRESQRRANENLYDGMRALMGVGPNWGDRNKKPKGLLLQMQGESPKTGYFQDTLLSRRQDLSMRGTITPEPDMSIDEVGLPTHKALDLFRPFVVKKLQDLGVASTPREAQDILAKERKKGRPSTGVLNALDSVMEERPILLKRDPSLHKHSVQAFKARRAPGKAIQIHPLTVGGFGADFDGDTMAAYVPVGREAVKEAFDMMPSKNIYNEASGRVMYTPSLEASLGLFKLSRVTDDSKKTFKTQEDILAAAEAGKIGVTQKALVGGKLTTPGRVMLAKSMPGGMQEQVLHDLDFRLNKNGVNTVYSDIAKNHKQEFGQFAGRLMNLGYDASFGVVKLGDKDGPKTAYKIEKEAEDPKKHGRFVAMGTHSFGLKDFLPDKQVRDPIIKRTQAKVDKLMVDTRLSKSDRERQATEMWFDATNEIVRKHDEKEDKNPNNLHIMKQAGVKPSPDQYRQLRLAPMLITDSTNRIISKPVTKSYSEGLDIASYWNQMSGARRGSVLKVQEVQGPGYFTKRLMNTNMGMQVTGDDCGTARGVSLNIGSGDVYDRELAAPVTVGGQTFSAGTTLTPDVVQTIRKANDKINIQVRSPLKCEHGVGLCQKCAGRAPDGDYYKKGTNVGVLATQALGERSTQLTLKAFHSGGVAKKDAGLVNSFKRVLELTELPKDIPDSATVAMKSGVITKVEKDPIGLAVYVNDRKHVVGKDRFGKPLWQSEKGQNTAWQMPKVGMKVQAGDSLSDPSRTNINVRHLYRATNSIDAVQDRLSSELHKIYGEEGVRRQHVELVVKSMSNLTKVRDPGDDPDAIKGSFMPTSVLQAKNKELVKAGKKPVQHSPVLKGIDVMPLEVQEDWMAKMNHNKLRQTVSDAATYGQSSDLHGVNPIPGMAYGAEFGLTKKDQFRKPHLKNVPDWSY